MPGQHMLTARFQPIKNVSPKGSLMSAIFLNAPQLRATLLGLSIATLFSYAHAYDLQQAYADAVAVDPLTASANAALNVSREKLPQAKALELPVVNGSASVTRQAVDSNLAPTRNFTARSAGINLTYPVYRAQNIESIEQAKLAQTVSEAQLASAKQDLIVKVAQAYFDVLSSQDSLAVIRAQKRAVSEQLQSAKRNFEVGTATITDQQEAQARADLVLFQEIAGANDLETKLIALATLTGKSPNAMSPLNSLRNNTPLAGPLPAELNAWSDAAKANNYAVQQASIAVENAKRELAKQHLSNRPTLDLVGSISRSENAIASSVGLTSNSAALGLQLAVPLYTGGVIDSRVREAAASLNKNEFDLTNAKNQAELAARQAYLGLNSLLNQVTALQAAEKSSRLSLDSNLLGYQVGVRINIDVLNAQQQVFATQRDLAKVRYDVLVNGLKLKAVTASLRPDDIASVNGLLEIPPPAPQPVSLPDLPAKNVPAVLAPNLVPPAVAPATATTPPKSTDRADRSKPGLKDLPEKQFKGRKAVK
jgi:outer membrane protein